MTCISSSRLSPLNLITYHCPLRHIPTITDFGSLVSETPAPVLPPTSRSSKWIGKVQSSSSYRTSRILGRHLPSSLPTKQMLPPQQVPFLLRKLSHPLSRTMAPCRSFTSGGPRSKSGSLAPMPMPLINRRWWLFSRTWKALTQVCLDECMAANAWPTWAALQAEIEGFFLPRNNKEWARSQLLRLHQGPRQRIDDFLAQFQALKLQSECPDEYAKDLLERAVTHKILEQVYMQGLDRTTWVCVTQAIRTVGRAQELFLINMTSPTRYFSTNHYASSSGTPSGSSAPMDIGAANTHPQRGKGIQCYNCQGFSHISRECTQPQWAWQQSPQQGWAVQPQVDPHNDDERVKAV